jgi:hypothetical protein
MTHTSEALTWPQLVELEPALLALYQEAQAVDGRDAHFCANQVWYDSFKPRLLALAGWEAREPALRTQEAYDLAYETIYAALPPCRDCQCL